MTRQQSPTIRREDYRTPDYRIEQVELEFDLGLESTRVKAKLAIRAADTRAGVRPLVLDGEDLELVALSLDGKPLSDSDYTVDEKGLTVHAPPAAFTLDIETTIHPTANTQ